MTQKGLFERQPFYYALQFVLAGLLVVFTLVLVASVDNFLLQCSGAALLAFTSGQLGFLGHDLGHRQVFRGAGRNNAVMLILNPLVGISPSWWIDSHNRHHRTPNDLELDPHTTIPVLAFSEDQARSKAGAFAPLIRFQSLYFVPLLVLSLVGSKINGVSFVAKGKAKYSAVEVVGFVLHILLYAGFLVAVMPLAEALIFAALHHGLTGLYFGLLFAPNHKGMATFSQEDRPSFLRSQVLTSRNIRPNFLVDFVYGGLNYQIEHHLFPTMPRNKLKAARPIVQSFCKSQGIDYYETSVVRSYAEVLGHLRSVTQDAPSPGKRSTEGVSS